MRKLLQLSGMLLLTAVSFGQDSLRGSVTPERAWWNVTKYDITVEADAATKSIAGENVMTFIALADGNTMQIDLQQPMRLDKASLQSDTAAIRLERKKNVYYLHLNKPVIKGSTVTLVLKFSGSPHEAVTPPWDGGWIWRTDRQGNPWMSVACQGLGASVW